MPLILTQRPQSELKCLGTGIILCSIAFFLRMFDPLNEYMAMYEWRAGGKKAAIVKAVFGDLAGAVGAAFYAMRLSAKPEIHLN